MGFSSAMNLQPSLNASNEATDQTSEGFAGDSATFDQRHSVAFIGGGHPRSAQRLRQPLLAICGCRSRKNFIDSAFAFVVEASAHGHTPSTMRSTTTTKFTFHNARGSGEHRVHLRVPDHALNVGEPGAVLSRGHARPGSGFPALVLLGAMISAIWVAACSSTETYGR